ncbi:hypothetical protein TWF694_010493 [Orbilia ellipsospora]|uniref:RING-type domain-containing protein n=1 Tax=Orbilia ellipsospora TaxID=2528407 RepID=A0AAV9XA22_9PEZI
MTDSTETTQLEADIPHDDLCPICRHLLHRPVITQCSHTLCEPCMAEWADVSVTSQMTPIPLTSPESADFNMLAISAKCPMCRTLTSAQRSEEVEERVKSRYPEIYAQREEEYTRDESLKDVSIVSLVVYVGNTAKLVEGSGSGERKFYDWEFFVTVSDTSVVNEVEILLVSQPALLGRVFHKAFIDRGMFMSGCIARNFQAT